MSCDEVNEARRKVNEALEEKSAKYYGYMKQWFRMKLTKEEFDTEARKLLPSRKEVYLHYCFLLALFNRVDGLADTSIIIAQTKASLHNKNNNKKPKRSTCASEKSNFDSVNLVEYLPPNSPSGVGSDGVKYAVREIYLPDHALVLGRFMLSAWEIGLESVDDDAAEIIVVAVQQFLKNVISSVVTQRKGYKLHNKHFMFDAGAEMPNMWLRNTSKLYNPQSDGRVNVNDRVEELGPRCPPTNDEMENAATHEIACSVPTKKPNDDKLTLNDLYDTLRIQRNVIACHSVYAVNMERIALKLNHPSD